MFRTLTVESNSGKEPVAAAARSSRSTPRQSPSSPHGVAPATVSDMPTSSASISAPSASPPALQPPLSAGDERASDLMTAPIPPQHQKQQDQDQELPKKKKKEKKEKKERKGHPQNALSILVGTVSGGAALRSNVVDLRELDPSPLQPTCKRSPRVSAYQDAPPTQILDFLFLGSVRDAQDAEFLAKHEIRVIINVSQEEYWSVNKKIQIFTYKVDDSASADIASLFLPTRSLINNVRDRYYRHEADGRTSRPAVLVHCQKGRSRSATIVLAYLIYMNGWSVAEAMKYVATRRPCAEPNIGFMEELRKLQESLAFEERTKRYSELCWFMRNLNAETSQAQVRELFERRVGMVRDVVMLAAPPNSSSSSNTSARTTRGTIPAHPVRDGLTAGSAETAAHEAAVGEDEEAAASINSASQQQQQHEQQQQQVNSPTRVISFTLSEEANDETSEAATRHDGFPVSVDDAAAAAAAAQSVSPFSADIKSPVNAAPNEPTALCFVFLTCREDVLRGIKSGRLREVLHLLHPAPGKHIKYATGPKLKRMMVEHQSMSNSFVQDMARFDAQLKSAQENGTNCGGGGGEECGAEGLAKKRPASAPPKHAEEDAAADDFNKRL